MLTRPVISRMVIKRVYCFSILFLHVASIVHCDEDFISAESAVRGVTSSQNNGIQCNMQGEECPTWFQPVRSAIGTVSCECGSSLGGIVRCIHRTNLTQLLSPYCMTASATYSNSSGMCTLVGKCPYNYHEADIRHRYASVPANISELNEHMCSGLNRTGLLCAHCENGLGPAVLSYELQCLECMESPYGWLLYVFLALFPVTVLYIIVVIFQVHGTSPSLSVTVFGSQILTCSVQVDIYYGYTGKSLTVFRVLKLIGLTIAGFWNLDFFRYVIPRFCVSNKLTSLHVVALEYLVACYPLFLIAITYTCIELHANNCRFIVCIWKPFNLCFSYCRRRWNPKTTIIHAFSTFLLLSYSKLLFVSLNLLASTKLYDVNGKRVGHTVVYLDASLPYLSDTHRPFAILALFVLSTLIAIPPLILLLYPTRLFQKCLGLCQIRWHPLNAFADTFQGYYKDGTNDTRDYRSFAGFYLILRILFLTVNMIDIHYSWIVGIVCPMIVSLLFALLRPYKCFWYTILDCLIFALMALLEFWILYSKLTDVISVPHALIYIVGMIPVIYFVLCISYKVLNGIGLLQKCQRRLRLWLLTRLPSGYPHQECIANNDELFPHRLLNPGEYQSLLSPSARGL